MEAEKESILSVCGDDFFIKLEDQIKTKIPLYVKNSLILNGYDSALLLSRLDEKCIRDIEEYMKNDFEPDHDQDAADYLGLYKTSQSKFKFVSGHKILLRIINETCKGYYLPNTRISATKTAHEAWDEDTKSTNFEKLSDGVVNWMKNQGNFTKVLGLELEFIINVQKNENSDDATYNMKCPVPSCSSDKTYSVIWKSYSRSTKNKDSSEIKFCQPRWFYCSLKNHLQKTHLDILTNVIELTDDERNDAMNLESNGDNYVPSDACNNNLEATETASVATKLNSTADMMQVSSKDQVVTNVILPASELHAEVANSTIENKEELEDSIHSEIEEHVLGKSNYFAPNETMGDISDSPKICKVLKVLPKNVPLKLKKKKSTSNKCPPVKKTRK